MTNEEIEKIQINTGITLPKYYVEFVTNYPEKLSETEAPDYGLLDNPEEIIEKNIDVRKNGYFGEKWPERYFIIGRNGCGDYYVVNLNSSEFSVGFSDHEKMECNLYAESQEEFISKLLKEME